MWEAILCQTDIQIIEDAEAVTGAANSHNSDRVEAAGRGRWGRRPSASGWLKNMQNVRARLWPNRNTHQHPRVPEPAKAASDWWELLSSTSIPWLPSVSLHPLPITLSAAPAFASISSTHIHPLRPEAEMLPKAVFYTSLMITENGATRIKSYQPQTTSSITAAWAHLWHYSDLQAVEKQSYS